MKFKKYFKLYAIVTQFLIQTIVLVILGLYFGNWLDKKLGIENDLLAFLFGIIGIYGGLGSMIIYVMKRGKKDEK